MSEASLEDKINQAGGPVSMLRSSNAGAYPFPIPSEYTNWRDEQRAWHETAVLFDQSHHMTDLYVQGPDALALVSHVGVNKFTGFGRNKAKQFVTCNQAGQIISDSILFGHDDDRFSLVGNPFGLDWLEYQAKTGGYDVEITRDERTLANRRGRLIFRFQLQGPAALEIAAKASGGSLPRIKFFNIGEFEIAGHPVRALNHTMVGVPGHENTGLEMWGPMEHGPEVWAALCAAGEEFGLRQGGAIAYSTTALESGWYGMYVPAIYSGDDTLPYRRHLRAAGFEGNASLGGSFDTPGIEDFYYTPFDVGYAHIVNFDHDFIGRDALLERRDEPSSKKVWLRWNDEDVTRLLAGGLLPDEGARTRYLSVPYGVYNTFQYDTVTSGDRRVGVSNRTGYTVNVGHWFSLAIVDEDIARDGADVVVLWGEPDGGATKADDATHRQTVVRAKVSLNSPVRP
ncbi:aminomethyl transferase family protein [Streptomyces sp. NPDC056716]|uniref:aminomethyl transferase family protein n=1 Tax=unclassified Streptomyces TaxID=2593676 RepID=UPI003685CC34